MQYEQARAVGPLDAIVKAFAHCFDWRGKASRSEFWWYWAFCTLTTIFLPTIIYVLIGVIGNNNYHDYFNPTAKYFYLHLTLHLITTVPALFLVIRRLRDSGRSPWWAVLGFWLLLLTTSGMFMDTTFGVRIWFTHLPYTFGTISRELFYFACLALCAMPANSGTSTWSPDRVPRGVGLLAGRIVVGFVIFELAFKFIGLPIILEIVYATTDWNSLSGQTIVGCLRLVVRESTLHLTLLVLILAAYKFEGRNISELFKLEEPLK